MHGRFQLRLVVLAFALAPVVGLGSRAHADVRIVASDGSGDFTSLQTAVDASSNGDVLLVRAGGYGGFVVDAKSLWIARHGVGAVNVAGTVQAKNLAASQRLVLSGLSVTGRVNTTAQPALRLFDNVGHVHAVDCSFTGANSPDFVFPDASGAAGAELQNSLFAVFVRCTIRGGRGGVMCDGMIGHPCGPEFGRGGHAVDTALSVPAFYQCTLNGGDGGDLDYYGPAGDGGRGCYVRSFGIFASDTFFTGGQGGDADDFFPADAGDGGAGLVVDTGAQAQLVQITASGGPGGNSFLGADGGAGPGISGGGNVNQLAATRRELISQLLVPESTSIPLEVRGVPGDRVYFATSMSPFFSYVPSQAGVRLLPPDTRWPREPLGTIPASGVLQTNVEMPELTTHDARALFGQARIVTAGGQTVLSGPVHFLVANCHTLNPDCNGNGSWDVCDLFHHLEIDCDENLVPDSCESDCNGNSIADACDIASGASTDINANGTPDECEPANMTWHVDASAALGGDGSAAHPFRTLKQGIQATLDGHTVLVHDGVYTGADNRNLDFSNRIVTVQSVSGPASCIVDLQDSGYAFRFTDNIGNSAAKVSGLTFVNGRNNLASSGGAITMLRSSPTIENCVFENCYGIAGAIWARDSRTQIRGCTFTSNHHIGTSAAGAGAVWIEGGPTAAPFTPSLVRCTFVGNQSDGHSGAVTIAPGSNGDVRMSHCKVLGNQAWTYGGGVNVWGSTFDDSFAVLDDCLIAGNSAGQSGGGVDGGGNLRLVNCTVTGNTAATFGGGVVRQFGAPSSSIESCIVWGNSAPTGPQLSVRGSGNTLTVRYCDVQGGQAQVDVAFSGTLTWGAGNISANPLFVDADGADNDASTLSDNDDRLASGSPCIDAGDTSALPLDVLDLDSDADTGELVPFDLDLLARRANDPAVADTGVGPAPVVDIGAYERRP